MKLRWLFVLSFFFQTTFLIGQAILVNDTGGVPDPSSILELRSTSQGILIPRMTAAQRLSIASPAQALMVFQTDDQIGFYFHNGTSWDTIIRNSDVNNTIINLTNVTSTTDAEIAVVRDVKGSGIDGGTFNDGSWEIRDLNHLSGDSSFIKIDGVNTFSLDSGIYLVSAEAPARGVNANQIRLYNITEAKVEAVGTAVKAVAASSLSKISIVIEVTATNAPNTFRIEHRCESTQNNNGFGEAITWGENIYTQIIIQKL